MNPPLMPEEELKYWRQQARQAWCVTHDNIQIDDDALISETDEGVWVNAWVWVPKEKESSDD